MRLLSIVILFCLAIQPVFAIIAIGTAQSEQEYASIENDWPKRLIILRKLFYESERLGKDQRTVEFLTDFHQRLKQRFVQASEPYLAGVSLNFQRLAASGYKPEMDVVINNHPLLMVKQPPLTIGSQQVPNLRPMSAETERWRRQQVRVAYVISGGSPPPPPLPPIFWQVDDDNVFKFVIERLNDLSDLQDIYDQASQVTILQLKDKQGKVRYFVKIKKRIFEVIIFVGRITVGILDWLLPGQRNATGDGSGGGDECEQNNPSCEDIIFITAKWCEEEKRYVLTDDFSSPCGSVP